MGNVKLVNNIDHWNSGKGGCNLSLIVASFIVSGEPTTMNDHDIFFSKSTNLATQWTNQTEGDVNLTL